MSALTKALVSSLTVTAIALLVGTLAAAQHAYLAAVAVTASSAVSLTLAVVCGIVVIGRRLRRNWGQEDGEPQDPERGAQSAMTYTRVAPPAMTHARAALPGPMATVAERQERSLWQPVLSLPLLWRNTLALPAQASDSEQRGTPPPLDKPPDHSTPPPFAPQPKDFDIRPPPPHGFAGFGQPHAPPPMFPVPGPPPVAILREVVDMINMRVYKLATYPGIPYPIVTREQYWPSPDDVTIELLD